MSIEFLDPTAVGVPGSQATMTLEIGPSPLRGGVGPARSPIGLICVEPGVYSGVGPAGPISVRLDSITNSGPITPRIILGEISYALMPITASTFAVEEDSAFGSGRFNGNWLITDLDRATWSGFSLTIVSQSAISAPATPLMHFYGVRVQAPVDLLEHFDELEVGDQPLRPLVWGLKYHIGVFSANDGFSAPRAGYFAPSIDVDYSQPLVFQDPPTSGSSQFARGFAAGMCNSGADLVMGFALLGKAAWHIKNNYNENAIRIRLEFGEPVILVEDQQRLVATSQAIDAIGTYFETATAGAAQLAESLMLDEIAGVHGGNLRNRLIIKFGAEMYSVADEYYDTASPYEIGRLHG